MQKLQWVTVTQILKIEHLVAIEFIQHIFTQQETVCTMKRIQRSRCKYIPVKVAHFQSQFRYHPKPNSHAENTNRRHQVPVLRYKQSHRSPPSWILKSPKDCPDGPKQVGILVPECAICSMFTAYGHGPKATPVSTVLLSGKVFGFFVYKYPRKMVWLK